MLIQDFEYFMEIARCHSISIAADNLYLTYQGLWKSVSRLENEIGNTLFKKTPLGVELTEFGQYFKTDIVEPLLMYYNEAKHCSERFEQYTSRNLRIGLPLERSTIIMHVKDICLEFKKQHPELEVEIVEQEMVLNKQALLEEKLDIGVCFSQEDDAEQFNTIPIFVREHVLMMSIDNPLSQKEYLTFDDIRNETFLISKSFTFAHRFLVEEVGIPTDHCIIYSERDGLFEHLITQNKVVFFRARESGFYPLYENCVLVPFNPPVCANIAFLYLKNTVPKKSLLNFIEYFNSEFKADDML